MTDLNQNTEANVDNVEPMKAEFTPDDLRVEIDKLMNKLRVSEVEVERERKRADDYLEKNRNITTGIFALIEPEILAAFTSMVSESLEDALGGVEFENAVDAHLDNRLETEIERALDGSEFLNADDIDERISDAIGDSSFDAAVRDVVREMINDGDITVSVENIELSLDA